jgi:hypothetical protein
VVNQEGWERKCSKILCKVIKSTGSERIGYCVPEIKGTLKATEYISTLKWRINNFPTLCAFSLPAFVIMVINQIS